VNYVLLDRVDNGLQWLINDDFMVFILTGVTKRRC